MGSYIEELQEDREKKSEIVVTVDGPSAAGKGTLAEFIAEELGVKQFSASDVFYSIAEERGLKDVEFSSEAEKEVDLEVDRKTLERGLKKSCVIDARIASWVLGDYADFTIHLTADLEERTRRLAEREGHDIEEARKILEERDQEDSRRYQNYYGIDTDDLEIYDLIVDNTDLNIEKQNRLVKKVLKQAFPERFED